MENKKLKLKIALTNIRRVITSILFINIMPIYNRVVLGTLGNLKVSEPTCYAAGPTEVAKKNNIFIIIVPIAVAIILIVGLVLGIKKHKKKKMENENDKKN